MDHNREVGVKEHEQTPGEAQLGETLESPVDKKLFFVSWLGWLTICQVCSLLKILKEPSILFRRIVHSPYSRDYGGNPKKINLMVFCLKLFFWTSATDVFRSNLTQQWSNSSDRKLIAPFQINSRATTNFDFHRYKVIELF